MAVKLSNSGNTLKLIVPSGIRKVICGQINYLGMVTSYKMSENEMGYRGSKSSLFNYNSQPLIINKGVKEQRVDGSWRLNKRLRCTLMGCESSYQVKIPSKQLNIRIYSTMPQAVSVVEQTLDPYFVTGITDAEASFTVSIYSEKKDKVNTKIRVMARFKIGLNIKDLSLLKKIQNFFGGIGTFTSDKNSNA